MGCTNSKAKADPKATNNTAAAADHSNDAQPARRASNANDAENASVTVPAAVVPAAAAAPAADGARIKRVLVLRNSVTGAASFSNKGVDNIIRTLKATYSGVTIVERDLVKNQVPFLNEETSEAIRNHKLDTENQKVADALANELIEEIKSVDLVVIGLPRYNFGTPVSFKTYLDYVARPRITFRYTENGPEGLLPNIPVWLVMSAGGMYGDDYYREWLNTILPFVGLKDLTYLPIEGTAVIHDDTVFEAMHGALLKAIAKL